MSVTVAAKRYADALYQLGLEKNTSDQLVEEFQVVKTVFEQNDQLLPFFEHPRLSLDQKKQFVDDVFTNVSADVVNTIKLLVERHRTDIISSMVDHFTQQVNEAKGKAEATIYSVRKLSDEELTHLERTFAKKFGKQSITFHTVVDPAILGGIKVQMGNTIIDGTISGKLQRIERSMRLANN
ncbi:F0F1 ATP synthase subunit delta [Lentibacillus saliphilus]|uniref:F0F1 ATP synthase subunit delta n=1 Tax=Lentibacillus saliphilus TaxID=2737028 RepID=UPI001C2FA1C6|nr:F0F1 ATP synthase subunit delta [Lentibacillus saliphilus]